MTVGPRVGARIKALRKRRKLKQEDLAALIDRSVESISAVERGKTMPSYTTLDRLAKSLDVPVTEFFDPPGRPPVGANRAGLLARLMDAANALSDPLLRAAVDQIEALERNQR